MSRIERLQPKFVDYIPAVLAPGILYISKKYQTASHLCCCGCGNKVVTPLKPGGWKLIQRGSTVSLDPSIGSWSLPCQSHYWIRGNKIEWAARWTKERIQAARANDQRARELFYERRNGFWRKLVDSIAGLFR